MSIKKDQNASTEPEQNSGAPHQGPEDPLGDRGAGDRTWAPPKGEQGLSNRPDDKDPAAPESHRPRRRKN